MQQLAYRYDAEVRDGGRLELTRLPFKKGTYVEVIVMKWEEDNFSDLLGASTTSLDFWDNPVDDEEWNHA